MLDGTIDGYDSLRSGRRRRSRRRRSTSARIAGTDMLYSSGTTGMPKGDHPPVRADAARRRRPPASAAMLGVLFGVDRGQRLPLPAPLYHAAPLRFMPRRDGPRRHRRRDGALRRRAVPRARRALPRHPHARSCRRCSCACSSCPRRCAPRYDVSSLQVRDPRRRAVPGPGQAADDRVVGPGHPRVLRRHRGQRLRLLQQREWLAHPGTVGTPIGCVVHICGDDGEELPHCESGHDLLRGRRPVRVPQRPGEDDAARATRRAGARSATSATSTTTATCTSPTARRT